jgi:hypothetical protein
MQASPAPPQPASASSLFYLQQVAWQQVQGLTPLLLLPRQQREVLLRMHHASSSTGCINGITVMVHTLQTGNSSRELSAVESAGLVRSSSSNGSSSDLMQRTLLLLLQ